MKLACSTILVCFNYSTSLSTDDSAFTNSTKGARLLRNDTLSFKLRCQLIVQIHKLSNTALRTTARVVKAKHGLLHIALQVNKSKPYPFTFLNCNPRENTSRTVSQLRVVRGAMQSGKKWRNALWLNAMHSGKK